MRGDGPTLALLPYLPLSPGHLYACPNLTHLLCPCFLYLLLHQSGEVGKVGPREKLLPIPTALALAGMRGSCLPSSRTLKGKKPGAETELEVRSQRAREPVEETDRKCAEREVGDQKLVLVRWCSR